MMFSAPAKSSILLGLAILLAITPIADANAAGSKSKKSKSSKYSGPDLKSLGERLKEAVAKKEMSSRDAGEAHRLISFYVNLDENKDGVIEPREIEQHRSRSSIERRVREAGYDPARPFKISSFMTKRLKNAGLDKGHIKSVVGQAWKKSKAVKKLNLQLPEKYAETDRDNDNQLGLYEWPRAQLQEFLKLDRNGDGFVTPRELQLASESESKK